MQPSENRRDTVRIELTREQREQVRGATGRDTVAVELTLQELEERIAPGWTNNHNEILLADR